MGLQLILVVEANVKCKSDWIYIKDTIEQFYQYDRAQVKFSPVYMDGKGNYVKKKREIKQLISQYASSAKGNRSVIIYCFDCDDYDIKPEDSQFLHDAEQYCRDCGAKMIWFCKDIERVYLGRQVDKNQKRTEAARFKTKKLINNIDADRLCVQRYQKDSSNIMCILDTYLARK